MTDSVKSLKEQLKQLEALHQQGALSEVAFQESKGRLERKLLELVMQDAGDARGVETSSGRPWTLWLVTTGFVLVIACAGYAWKGSPALVTRPPVAAASAQAGHAAPDAPQVEAMVRSLDDRLKNQPDDGPGWAMLARSYAVLGKVPEALQAYQKAVSLQDKDATLLADYADALAFSRQGAVQGEPVQLVARALKLEPSNTKALALAGSFAFAQGNYAQSIRHWEKLLSLAPPGTPVGEIERAIAQAREQLAAAGTSSSGASVKNKEDTRQPAPSSAGKTVSGVVELLPATLPAVRPEDTVFVFARPVDGSRMPLAVMRRQVKDLPLSFVLDDSMAMSSDRVLSAAGKVIISARISRSGNATPQPGDFSVQTEPVSVGAKDLRLKLGPPPLP